MTRDRRDLPWVLAAHAAPRTRTYDDCRGTALNMISSADKIGPLSYTCLGLAPSQPAVYFVVVVV